MNTHWLTLLKKTIGVALVFLSLAVGGFYTNQSNHYININTAARAYAASSCSTTLDTSLGIVSQTVNIPLTSTYRVWSRIKAPDTTNNSYYLQIDGGCAINVGDLSSMPANTWTWVNYQNGNTASIISLSLSAGAHQLVYNGRENGVELDRLIFTSDATCVPTGTGDNCTNSGTTTPIPGDLNNDGVVNVLDLSILLSNFGTANSVADINKDGTVNILDLSVLLSHYS